MRTKAYKRACTVTLLTVYKTHEAAERAARSHSRNHGEQVYPCGNHFHLHTLPWQGSRREGPQGAR